MSKTGENERKSVIESLLRELRLIESLGNYIIPVVYPQLLPGVAVPEKIKQSLLDCFLNLKIIVPTEQVQAIAIADEICVSSGEKILVLQAALCNAAGNTLWLHNSLAANLCALIDAGIQSAVAPSILHIGAFLRLADISNGAVPYMNFRMAKLLQEIAPRSAIHHAAIAMRGGEQEAFQLAKQLALQLNLLSDSELFNVECIEVLHKIEQACGIKSSSYVDMISTKMMNIPSYEVIPTENVLLQRPLGDNIYYVFNRAGRIEQRPAISVRVIEEGYISFDLTQLGRTKYYVFDKNRVCISDLSHGFQPFIMSDTKRHEGDLCQIGDLFCGPMNVCHFLLDHLSRVAIYDKFCDIPPAILLSENHPRYLKILERARLLDRVVLPIDKKFTIQAKRLLISSNIGPNASFRHPGHFCAPWVLEFLRDKLNWPSGTPKRNIFISRHDAKGRAVLNWPEVAKTLTRHDFEVVNLSEMTLEEQMECFSSAKLVVGVHGAGLTNILFSPPGTRILEILPPMVATGAYWILSQACKHIYSVLIADDPELPRPDYTNWGHHSEFNSRDLIIDIARLDVALEAMAKADYVDLEHMDLVKNYYGSK